MPSTRSAARIKPLSKRQIAEFFDILSSRIDPKSELKWHRPLDLLIAVVLSAQATDKAVNKVTADLFAACRTTDDYISLGEEKLIEYIRTIGLYRNKAKSIIGICQMLKNQFGDTIPDNRDDLQKLPGVGRKTANVILNVLYQQPTLAVDTHIFRVANRTGMVVAKTPELTEKALLPKISSRHLPSAHHYLILHGRYTCKARKPECRRCDVSHVCNYPQKLAAPSTSSDSPSDVRPARRGGLAVSSTRNGSS